MNMSKVISPVCDLRQISVKEGDLVLEITTYVGCLYPQGELSCFKQFTNSLVPSPAGSGKDSDPAYLRQGVIPLPYPHPSANIILGKFSFSTSLTRENRHSILSHASCISYNGRIYAGDENHILRAIDYEWEKAEKPSTRAVFAYWGEILRAGLDFTRTDSIQPRT